MRYVGTSSRGIRTPIIKEGDNLAKIVVDSLLNASQEEKFTFKAERLRQYIPKNLPPQQTEDYVIKALEHYQRFRERQKAQER